MLTSHSHINYKISQSYHNTIDKIKPHVKKRSFTEDYEFLNDYTYTLGAKADQLTEFGTNDLVNAGKQFYSQYSKVAPGKVPFIRASNMERVIESATNFSRGFLNAFGNPDTTDPYHYIPIYKIVERL